METIHVIIEASSDSFSAYADNVEGIYAHADTIHETMDQIKQAIEIRKVYDDAPGILKGEHDIIFKFDHVSFFAYIKRTLTLSGMETYTHINNKLLSNYAKGDKKPSAAQLKKIQSGMHEFARELLAIEL